MKNNKTHEKITPENLYATAIKAARHTLKFRFTMNPDQSILQLQNGFAHLNDPNNDTLDYVQVAAESLWENRDSPEAFKRACRDVSKFVSEQFPRTQKTKNSEHYKNLLKIRQILKGHNISAPVEEITKLKQIIVDLGITAENVEQHIAAEKKLGKKHYSRRVTSLGDFKGKSSKSASESDLDENPDYSDVIADERNDIADLIDEISNSAGEAISTIKSALKSERQQQVVALMGLGYLQIDIAASMKITEPRVSQHVNRIREIAKSCFPKGVNEILH